MATALIALAIISTGLYAGFMLTFLTGVMPALARLTDEQFLAAMRRINEVVPRPLFLLTFAGVVVFPALALAFPEEGRGAAATWLIVAGLVCSVLNHLVTVAGNIPLNNALAATERGTAATPGGTAGPGRTPDWSGRSDQQVRHSFEGPWNRFHLVRTLFTVAAFALLVTAALW
ncbi:anthrone oxygenase family protein [Streptomyces sp. NPDC003691]